jgi:hypothetical protein
VGGSPAEPCAAPDPARRTAVPGDHARVGYLWYLYRLVEGGFASRIMFGCYSGRSGIQTIVDAPFLSREEKAGILCGNAARFLRLAASICAP